MSEQEQSRADKAAESQHDTPESGPNGYDEVGAIMAYEMGELDEDATVELFQHLVNTGLAWKLQGSYGRTAHALIEAGLVERPKW